MRVERWQAAQQVFLALLELSPDEREAALLERCGDDRELREAVRRLLAADALASDVLRPAERLPALALEQLKLESEREELEPGTQVGAFRVVRRIGQGGMGSVFLAERADGQFEQRVAVKVVRRGLVSGDLLRRFLEERRILAGLEHPHIARLLDGGLLPDGRPYFAMEHVEGRPLAAFVREQALAVPARLRLFLDVCRAVDYAHRRLVVHLDLKPSNVLVSDDGRVHLLDFGLARLLDGETRGDTATTIGPRRLTPEYAAPEQLLGGALTTATDVYSLGVVLYELLTGRRPHGTAEQRLATAREATAPSAAALSAGEPAATPRERRRLARQLRGDLDLITLRALRSEPEQRYASARDLQEDLERYLAGRPILARRDALAYRLVKFARRQRLAASFAALALLALAAGAAGILWQARVARQEARRAERAKEFVVDLLGSVDPNVAKGRAPNVREMLDRGLARVRASLGDEPELQDDLLLVLSGLYDAQGAFEPALSLAQGVLARERQRYGAAHVRTARAQLACAQSMFSVDRYEEGERSTREALAILARSHGPRHVEVGKAHCYLGFFLVRLGRPVEASAEFEQGVGLLREAQPVPQEELARALVALGSIRQDARELEPAERLYREALELLVVRRGELDLGVSEARGNLGTLLEERQRYPEALQEYEAALACDRQLLGDSHYYVAMDLSNVGKLRLLRGDVRGAEPLFAEACAVCERAYAGQPAVRCARLYANHAKARARLGLRAGTAELARRAVALARERLEPRHADIAEFLLAEAEVLLKLGSLEAAGQRLEQAREVLAHSTNPRDELRWQLDCTQGALLQAQGRPQLAIAPERSCLEARERGLGQADWRTATARLELARALAASGASAQALPLVEQGARALAALFGPEHPDVRAAQAEHARLLASASPVP